MGELSRGRGSIRSDGQALPGHSHGAAPSRQVHRSKLLTAPGFSATSIWRHDGAILVSMEPHPASVDLSGLYRELDRLNTHLCRCHHRGECLACRGFQILRQQCQVVAAAASQPALLQVAQEAAAKDLMTQLGGLQEKLAADPRLQELLTQLVERAQEDLGGPEQLQRLFGDLGGLPGFPGFPSGGGQPPPDDVPPDDAPRPRPRPRED
jgi:hypothetical protein